MKAPTKPPLTLCLTKSGVYLSVYDLRASCVFILIESESFHPEKGRDKQPFTQDIFISDIFIACPA